MPYALRPMLYVTGNEFLILASDGLLPPLSPGEVCAIAAALAAGEPLPPLPATPAAAIPLGPVSADIAPTAVPLARTATAATTADHSQNASESLTGALNRKF